MDALDVLCAQLTRDLFAIAKFLFETNYRLKIPDALKVPPLGIVIPSGRIVYYGP